MIVSSPSTAVMSCCCSELDTLLVVAAGDGALYAGGVPLIMILLDHMVYLLSEGTENRRTIIKQCTGIPLIVTLGKPL